MFIPLVYTLVLKQVKLEHMEKSLLGVGSLRSSESSVKLKRLFACSFNELLVLPPEAYAVTGLVKRAIFRYN
jgi:hypothetical protein